VKEIQRKSFCRSKKIKWISSNDSFKPLTTAHVCAVLTRHLIRLNTQSGATNAERYFLDVEDVWDDSCRSAHCNFYNGRRHWSALLWLCVFSGFHRDVDQFCAHLGYYAAYLLSTPWNILLEKLTGFQLVQKFPACYETRRFITAYTSDCYLPYSEPPRSSPHFTSYFLKIHLNIILPSMPGSPKWPLSLRYPNQNPLYASPLSHTCYMPRQSLSSRFYHPNNIG